MDVLHMESQASGPMVAEGRGFTRLRPQEALDAVAEGAQLIDIRRAADRRTDGEIPGSLVVAGPLRDWRLGPQNPVRICELRDRAVVVCCATGQSSLLVASALYGMGLPQVTDIAGGFAAWVATQLPVVGGGTLVGRFTPGSLVPEHARALSA